MVAARRVSGPTYIQYHLQPGATYRFLVRAENSHGFSPPSGLSEPVAIEAVSDQKHIQDEDERIMKEAKSTLLAGHIVELIEAVAVSSTSIKLVWEVKRLISIGSKSD